MTILVYSVPIIAILALVFAGVLHRKIKKAPEGNAKMKEIAKAIREGSMAFLKSQYKILFVYIIVLALILGYFLDDKTTAINDGLYTSIAFVVGAICSILAGYIGMRTATQANVRTTNQAKKGLKDALTIAFSSGAVMGLSVVGLGLLGLSMVFYLFALVLGIDQTVSVSLLSGFGLGASSIALFARVGGGIYTKAADIGADLVGKVEAGIPEDDPRNPAVIADNVGDNVGDVAGMGADLFESYVGSIIASMILGVLVYGISGFILPLSIAASGIIASIIGTYFVKAKDEHGIHTALKRGLWVASGLVVLSSLGLSYLLLPSGAALGVFLSVVTGLIVGILIGLVTEYYTSYDYKPVKELAESAKTGSATTIISGLALGYASILFPILLISAAIMISYSLAGLYGIALSAVGMLSTLGISLAIDAYGPVADNAGGIAEMAGLPKKVRQTTDMLDAAGNTTAAIGKGFAIGSAALTALALFSAFTKAAGLTNINIQDPKVMVGLLLGAMLPYLFSALTMKAVGRAAFAMIEEVRRQFKTIPGLMEGKAKADYKRCVAISTNSSLKEMVIPGLLAVIAPISVGVFIGIEALGGLLAGSLVSGVVLAISMANSGGAWDNAKKYIETGMHGGKGSDAHKAAVVGDTVGDPFKDTSGPSINILIKLMSIVSLVFVPLFLLFA
ncbi:sodium-translocating pyrophosphatase [Candidatus Woesearchaeota archaeon]|nr:sodium-translocating pyrophosphatase [Candidatus Woesearchaeota archaeon]